MVSFEQLMSDAGVVERYHRDLLGEEFEGIKNELNINSFPSDHTLSLLAYKLHIRYENLKKYISVDGVDTELLKSDDFWGHFGIKLDHWEFTNWYPISSQASNRLSSILSQYDSESKWIVLETLSNRMLAFRPSVVNRIWLLDDAADQVAGDWVLPSDGYSGNADEFYRSLEEYYLGELGVGSNAGDQVSELVMRDVVQFTDEADLDEDGVCELIEKTRIYCSNGEKISIEVGVQYLAEFVERIEGNWMCDIANLSGDQYELFIPSERICLFDMPKRKVELELQSIAEKEALDFE